MSNVYRITAETVDDTVYGFEKTINDLRRLSKRFRLNMYEDEMHNVLYRAAAQLEWLWDGYQVIAERLYKLEEEEQQ